jgi:hypothetical protein
VLGRSRGLRIGETPDRDGQYFHHLAMWLGSHSGTHDDRLAHVADRILLIEEGHVRELAKAEHRARTAGRLLGVGPAAPSG